MRLHELAQILDGFATEIDEIENGGGDDDCYRSEHPHGIMEKFKHIAAMTSAKRVARQVATHNLSFL